MYKQILVAIVANISSAGFGLAMGWSSPNVPKLQDVALKDTPLGRNLTASEVGWIGSLVSIGGAISPFFAGTIADKFGRKSALLLSGVILFASFVLLGFGQSIELIYVARLMHGFCIGLTMTVMPMYIGEITQDKGRGALATLMIMFLDVGVLFSFCVGPFVSYVTFQFICLSFPITFLVLFPFMPETPTYHLLGGHKERAIKSLMFLRNTTKTNVLPELGIIQRSINENRTGSWTKLVLNRGNRRALIISCGLTIAAQVSGISAIVYYAQSIFTRASTLISPVYAAIIIGLVPLTIDFCTPFAIERFGRRRNLIISAIGSGIGLAILTIYFYLVRHNVTFVQHLPFLPIISLIMYIAFFNIGFASVPWALMGELFVPDIKGRGSIIATTASTLSSAIILQFFETLNESIGPFWVFAAFTLCTCLGLAFIIVFVFETKSITLVEIQRKLNKV